MERRQILQDHLYLLISELAIINYYQYKLHSSFESIISEQTYQMHYCSEKMLLMLINIFGIIRQ